MAHREFGIKPMTLYRYVEPQGELREQGQKVLASRTGASDLANRRDRCSVIVNMSPS